jgi:hypothetical protein
MAKDLVIRNRHEVALQAVRHQHLTRSKNTTPSGVAGIHSVPIGYGEYVGAVGSPDQGLELVLVYALKSL